MSELQLRTVVVDAAVLYVPAQSSGLAPDQQLVPHTGGTPRFGNWFDVFAKSSSPHEDRNLTYVVEEAVLRKCESTCVNILIYI